MAEFEAVVLAAGLSSRMGTRNKLLLDWFGAPMITHVVRSYVEAVPGSVTVVTGFEADQITDALAGLPVTFCHNKAFESGQQSSVVAALQQPGSARAMLLGLGDQPLLRPADLRWLMDAHCTHDPRKITVPVRNGTRGNPIVIPAGLRPRLLENPRAPGCRRFTRDNPGFVTLLECTQDGFFADIDTADDFARAHAMSGDLHEATS